MTTETYKLNGNTLIQQPEMKEPNVLDYNNYEVYKKVAYEFQDHIASLKSYDISGSVPAHWKGCEDLKEGVDFKKVFQIKSSFGEHNWITSWEEHYILHNGEKRILARPILKEGNDNRDEQLSKEDFNDIANARDESQGEMWRQVRHISQANAWLDYVTIVSKRFKIERK